MARIVWDGKKPKSVEFDDGSSVYAFPSSAVPVVPMQNPVRTPWGIMSKDLWDEILATDTDPYSRSLEAVESEA